MSVATNNNFLTRFKGFAHGTQGEGLVCCVTFAYSIPNTMPLDHIFITPSR